MANDNFLHDESGVATLIGDVNSEISSYVDNIEALNNLVSSIESSSAWKDEQVKTAFVNAAKSYISSYKTFATGLDVFMQCLTKKSENITEHESKFS